MLLLLTLCSVLINDANSFAGSAATTLRQAVSSSSFTSSSRLSSTVSETSAMMKDMRDQLNGNDDARMVMDALRGKNLNDDDAALDGLQMRLIDVGVDDNADPASGLPYEYDPAALQRFFEKRPLSVLTRILQLANVGGGLALKLGIDALFNRIKDDPELEIKRAGELRDTITSLGPFYIKIGQALSIRPDILSPRSMVELQKLCDKVPSFDSKTAFATIERELGRPVNEIFSEITPEPVAAAA